MPSTELKLYLDQTEHQTQDNWLPTKDKDWEMHGQAMSAVHTQYVGSRSMSPTVKHVVVLFPPSWRKNEFDLKAPTFLDVH